MSQIDFLHQEYQKWLDVGPACIAATPDKEDNIYNTTGVTSNLVKPEINL